MVEMEMVEMEVLAAMVLEMVAKALAQCLLRPCNSSLRPWSKDMQQALVLRQASCGSRAHRHLNSLKADLFHKHCDKVSLHTESDYTTPPSLEIQCRTLAQPRKDKPHGHN